MRESHPLQLVFEGLNLGHTDLVILTQVNFLIPTHSPQGIVDRPNLVISLVQLLSFMCYVKYNPWSKTTPITYIIKHILNNCFYGLFIYIYFNQLVNTYLTKSKKLWCLEPDSLFCQLINFCNMYFIWMTSYTCVFVRKTMKETVIFPSVSNLCH